MIIHPPRLHILTLQHKGYVCFLKLYLKEYIVHMRILFFTYHFALNK